MDDRFIQVRLSRGTAARLRQFAKHTQRLAEVGRLVATLHPTHGLTLETAVSILLDRWEAHRRRSMAGKR